MHSARLRNDLMKMAGDEVEHLKAYKTAGKIIFDAVTKFIKPRSKFSISRQIIAGSTGKNTTLGHSAEPDFDVILFVNNVTHLDSLKPVTEDFHTILQDLPDRSVDWDAFKIKPFLRNGSGVQFAMEKVIAFPTGLKSVTIEFDLLPAYDFSSDVDQHTRMVLEEIRKSGNLKDDNYKYSSSLSEKTVEFIKKQSAFVRYVIRLGKLWDKKLKDDVKRRGGNSYLSGRSSIIELIAVRAAQKSEGNILIALRKLLEFMQSLDRININFSGQNYHQPYAKMMIVGAVNPYHNFADGLKQTHIRDFSTRAVETLRALSEVENSGSNYELAWNSFKKYLGKD